MRRFVFKHEDAERNRKANELLGIVVTCITAVARRITSSELVTILASLYDEIVKNLPIIGSKNLAQSIELK